MASRLRPAGRFVRTLSRIRSICPRRRKRRRHQHPDEGAVALRLPIAKPQRVIKMAPRSDASKNLEGGVAACESVLRICR